MTMPKDALQLTLGALGAASFILLLVRRRVRLVERRVALVLLSALLISVAYLIYLFYRYNVALNLLIPALLIEFGIFARIYDSYRSFRSISGTLRNLGNLYIFSGVVCLLSRSTGFPLAWWGIPVILFSLGYFFTKKKRGLGNLCKGLAVLISVAFTASILYDVRAGAQPGKQESLFKTRLLPNIIIRPSLVEELNSVNKKLAMAEGEKSKLAEELVKTGKERDELKKERQSLQSGLAEAEKARDENKRLLQGLRAENQELQKKLNAEKEARSAAEQKLEGAKAAGKESFTAIEEKLKLAADNLKKVVAEKDALAAELESLKSASAATPGAGQAEISELKKKLSAREQELQAVSAERDSLKKILARIAEEIPAWTPAPGPATPVERERTAQ